jgi:hypothetical protein
LGEADGDAGEVVGLADAGGGGEVAEEHVYALGGALVDARGERGGAGVAAVGDGEVDAGAFFEAGEDLGVLAGGHVAGGVAAHPPSAEVGDGEHGGDAELLDAASEARAVGEGGIAASVGGVDVGGGGVALGAVFVEVEAEFEAVGFVADRAEGVGDGVLEATGHLQLVVLLQLVAQAFECLATCVLDLRALKDVETAEYALGLELDCAGHKPQRDVGAKRLGGVGA